MSMIRKSDHRELVIREQQYVQDDNDDEDSVVGEYGHPEGEEELEDVTE